MSKVFPQKSQETKLIELLRPFLEKLSRDASSRRHIEIVEDCQDILRWFVKPVSLSLESVSSPNSSSESGSLPPFTPRSSEFCLSSDSLTASKLSFDCLTIAPSRKAPEKFQENGSKEEKLFSVAVEMFSRNSLSKNGLVMNDGSTGIDNNDAQFLLKPFFSACKTNSTTLADTAVKAIARLLVGGHLRGIVGPTKFGPGSVLLRQMVDSLCSTFCLVDESASLEMTLLETLLFLGTSPQIILRGDALLQVFRTIFTISTRSQVSLHSLCGKSALSQVISVALNRLDIPDDVDTTVDPIIVDHLVSIIPRSHLEISFAQNFLNRALSGKFLAFNSGKMESSLQSIVPAGNNVPEPEAFLGTESCDSKYMKRRFKERGKEQNYASPVVGKEENEGNSAVDEGELPGSFQNDSFLVLQELCRLSMVSPYRIGGEIDAFALKEKTLALEILCFVLEKSDQNLKSSHRF